MAATSLFRRAGSLLAVGPRTGLTPSAGAARCLATKAEDKPKGVLSMGAIVKAVSSKEGAVPAAKAKQVLADAIDIIAESLRNGAGSPAIKRVLGMNAEIRGDARAPMLGPGPCVHAVTIDARRPAGEPVSLRGLGRFELKATKPRRRYNVHTKDFYDSGPGLRVSFTPSEDFKTRALP